MKTYEAIFTGKLIGGSLGDSYQIKTIITGDNEQNARLNLYKEYEHIMFLKLKELNND